MSNYGTYGEVKSIGCSISGTEVEDINLASLSATDEESLELAPDQCPIKVQDFGEAAMRACMECTHATIEYKDGTIEV